MGQTQGAAGNPMEIPNTKSQQNHPIANLFEGILKGGLLGGLPALFEKPDQPRRNPFYGQ